MADEKTKTLGQIAWESFTLQPWAKFGDSADRMFENDLRKADWEEAAKTVAEHVSAPLLKRIEELEAALTKIAKWHGEFPETGRTWSPTDPTPMSYGACYGSNGERDFMRDIATKALERK